MATPIDANPRGVLRSPAESAPGAFVRLAPAAPVAGHVEHFWGVTWDLEGRAPVVRETLPHPSVHVIIEAGRSGVAGVATRRFTRTLEGRGRVLGIKFHPGCFRPFHGMKASAIAGRVLPLREVFGPEARTFESQVLACGDDLNAGAQLAESFLLTRLPPPDPQAQLARQTVARILSDPSLTRAEDVARAAGLSLRSLQRLFSAYVGVGPKWVIQRYRLHEAIARLGRGGPIDFAGLAIDLGYADQAHFIRDFKALVGVSPGAYASPG